MAGRPTDRPTGLLATKFTPTNSLFHVLLAAVAAASFLPKTSSYTSSSPSLCRQKGPTDPLTTTDDG